MICWDAASHLLPLLQHVADIHPDASIKQTATDIRVLIATHGYVDVSGCSDFSQTQPSDHVSDDSCLNEVDGTASKTKPLIEVISSREATIAEQSSSQSTPSVFETAMKEAADILVPVRGHALLTLRHLVDSGDTETSNSADKVLAVCERTLDDPDSYVYLNSIQLLSSLASRLPQQTLPWLADRYLAVRHHPAAYGGCQQSVAERRMKLGEVLVKTSSALGMYLERKCFT